jgi:excisionase family DNA binding protein
MNEAVATIVGKLIDEIRCLPERPELLTTEQVGRMLALSARTVRAMVSAGQLPSPIHVGSPKNVRFTRASILRYIADRERHAEATRPRSLPSLDGA